MGSLGGAYSLLSLPHTPAESEAKRGKLRGEWRLFKIEVKQGTAYWETRNELAEVGAL